MDGRGEGARLGAISIADRHGQPVRVGDSVKVLAVSFDPQMDDDARELVESMIGGIGVVEELDGQGRAWVSRCWTCSDGATVGQVMLAPHQMERVEGAARVRRP